MAASKTPLVARVRTRTCAAAVLPLLAQLACAPRAAPDEVVQAPEQAPVEIDSRGWLELTSAHFDLYTDLSPGEAQTTLLEFEELYHQLRHAIFQGQRVPEMRSTLILFSSAQEFSHIAPNPSVVSFFRTRLAYDIEPSPTLVLKGGASKLSRAHFVHELAHRFLRVAMGNMPPWLDEGLASYFSTIRRTEGPPRGQHGPDPQPHHEASATLWLGDHEMERGFTERVQWHPVNHGTHWQTEIPIATLPTASELIHFNREEFYPATVQSRAYNDEDTRQMQETANYGAAWALVHMLLNGPDQYRPQFREALGKIAEGESAHRAIAATLEIFDTDALDRDLIAHIRASGRRHWTLPYEPAPLARTELGPMSPARVQAMLARLAYNEQDARHLLQKARELDPTDPEIDYGSGTLAILEEDWHAAAKHLGRAVMRNPADPRYLHALCWLYVRGDTPWSHAQRAQVLDLYVPQLARFATTAQQMDTVAWHALVREDFARAHAYAERSLALDSACWQCFDTYARVLYALDQTQAAIENQALAVERMPLWIDDHTSDAMKSRLAHYQSALAPTDALASPRH